MVFHLKDLLQEYKKTLKATNRELNGGWKNRDLTDCEAYLNTLKAAKSDLEFVVKWLEKGYQPDAHFRGIQRNDAYYVMRSYDPSIIERYIENKQANEPYEDFEKVFECLEDKEEYERICFEDALTWEEAKLFEQAKSVLRNDEKELLILLIQGESQEQIAKYMGVSRPAIFKRIRLIKKKLSKLGIERIDL